MVVVNDENAVGGGLRGVVLLESRTMVEADDNNDPDTIKNGAGRVCRCDTM